MILLYKNVKLIRILNASLLGINMRKTLERILIVLFDRLPKNLKQRTKYFLVIIYGFIIAKRVKRGISYLRKTNKSNTKFQDYCSEIKKQFRTGEIPQDASQKEVCIRFSGGTDSTLVAATMAAKFKKVHLLTFNTTYKINPLGMTPSDPSCTYTNLNNLVLKFGRKFVHRIIDIESLRNRIYFDDYLPNFKKDDFLKVSFCPACSLAMHLETIIYCLSNNIEYASDGAGIDSGVLEWQTQSPHNLREIEYFYKGFGLKYIINPNYYVIESDNELFNLGVIKDKDIKNNYSYRRKTQQYCILIQFQSICRILEGRKEAKMASLSEHGMVTKYFKHRMNNYQEYVKSKRLGEGK